MTTEEFLEEYRDVPMKFDSLLDGTITYKSEDNKLEVRALIMGRSLFYPTETPNSIWQETEHFTFLIKQS